MYVNGRVVGEDTSGDCGTITLNVSEDGSTPVGGRNQVEVSQFGSGGYKVGIQTFVQMGYNNYNVNTDFLGVEVQTITTVHGSTGGNTYTLENCPQSTIDDSSGTSSAAGDTLIARGASSYIGFDSLFLPAAASTADASGLSGTDTHYPPEYDNFAIIDSGGGGHGVTDTIKGSAGPDTITLGMNPNTVTATGTGTDELGDGLVVYADNGFVDTVTGTPGSGNTCYADTIDAIVDFDNVYYSPAAQQQQPHKPVANGIFSDTPTARKRVAALA